MNDFSVCFPFLFNVTESITENSSANYKRNGSMYLCLQFQIYYKHEKIFLGKKTSAKQKYDKQ